MSQSRILMINPNSTDSMTDKMHDAAQGVLRAFTHLDAKTSTLGPPSIEGFADGAVAVPPLLDIIRSHPEYDGYIIGCFDDTGLDAARVITSKPVVGIGEAAMHVASILSVVFAVVTTMREAVPVITQNLQRYGLGQRCCAVRAANIPVLDLEDPSSNAVQRISEQIQIAIEEQGAEAIVLGCAGMVDLAADLTDRFGVPVINGVVSAVAIMQALTQLGYRTSKVGGYAMQRMK